MIELGQALLVIIAITTFATMLAVLYYGAKENLGTTLTHSDAQKVWEERANRVEAARNSLVVVADGGDAGGTTTAATTLVNPDDAEARRQAALARRAARAAKSPVE